MVMHIKARSLRDVTYSILAMPYPLERERDSAVCLKRVSAAQSQARHVTEESAAPTNLRMCLITLEMKT